MKSIATDLSSAHKLHAPLLMVSLALRRSMPEAARMRQNLITDEYSVTVSSTLSKLFRAFNLICLVEIIIYQQPFEDFDEGTAGANIVLY